LTAQNVFILSDHIDSPECIYLVCSYWQPRMYLSCLFILTVQNVFILSVHIDRLSLCLCCLCWQTCQEHELLSRSVWHSSHRPHTSSAFISVCRWKGTRQDIEAEEPNQSVHLTGSSFIELFIHLVIHLFSYSFIQLFIHFVIHSLSYSFIQLFIYSVIHSLSYSL